MMLVKFEGFKGTELFRYIDRVVDQYTLATHI